MRAPPRSRSTPQPVRLARWAILPRTARTVVRCVTRGVARLPLPHRGEVPGLHETSMKTTAHSVHDGLRGAFANSSELLGGSDNGCANLLFAVQARDEEANTGRVLVDSRVEDGMNLDASPEKPVRKA